MVGSQVRGRQESRTDYLGHCGTELRKEIFNLTNYVGNWLHSAPRIIPGVEHGRNDVNTEFFPFGMLIPETTSFDRTDAQYTLANSLWKCPQCVEQVFGQEDGQRSPVYHEWAGIILHTEIRRDGNGTFIDHETQFLCGLCGAICTRVAPGYVDPHIDAYRARRSAQARNRMYYSGGCPLRGCQGR